MLIDSVKRRNNSMRMNMTHVAVITVLVGTLFVGSQPVNAFWPFDQMEGGQVQGDQTQATGGFFEAFFKKSKPMVAPNPSFMPRPSGEMIERTDDKMSTEVLGKRLDEAVKNGKMTEAQKTAVLTHLKGIEAKRKELRDLEKAFQDWLKTNKVILPFLFRPAAPESMFFQGKGPSGATGIQDMRRPMNPQLQDRRGRMDDKRGNTEGNHPTETSSEIQ
jgi:hypothetical protein